MSEHQGKHVTNALLTRLHGPRLTLRARLALGVAVLLVVLDVAMILFVNVTATTIISGTDAVAFMPSTSGSSEGATGEPHLVAAVQIAQRASLEEVRRVSLLGLALTLTLGVAGAYWLTGRALRPTRAMARTAGAISANRLNARLGLTGPKDEIKQLADAFDAMLDRLDNAFKQQGRFISDAAHELRTPLAIMRANLDVMQSDPQASLDDYREMADTVGRNLERLEDMVADLLVLAREECKLTREALSLGVVLGQALDDLAELAHSSGVKWRLSSIADVVVYGNAALLTRVFSNLIENGIRYNRPGGEVAVSLQRSGEWAIVTITDTGVGISSQEQVHIFERFYRVDETRAHHKGGAGLGLAIVAHIVQSHAGQIDVRSRLGSGSTFTVQLPAVRKS